MSKLEKETSAAKTIQAYKDAATQIGLVLKPGDGLDSGDYPHDAYTNLRYIRRVNSIGKEHRKIIKIISRVLVTQRDEKGKPTKKEYIYYTGNFKAVNHRGIEYSAGFTIGKYNVPKIVQEVRQIIGPNSYDDNFNLIGYTSELRDRDGRFYAFVDFNADEVGKIRECPHCLEYEIHNKLQPRILKKGQVKPPDYDEFIQCYECGNISGIHETHFESKIKDSVETTDNPFEGNESIFLSTDNRATKT